MTEQHDITLSSETTTTTDLYTEWLNLKAQEKKAYDRRVEIVEPEILRRLQISTTPLSKSVSTTIADDEFKVKVTRNIVYKPSGPSSEAQLEMIFQSAPELKPYVLKPAISAAKLEELAKSHPNLWRSATQHLVSQENKATIAIERKESK